MSCRSSREVELFGLPVRAITSANDKSGRALEKQRIEGGEPNHQILIEAAADHRQHDEEDEVEQDRRRKEEPPSVGGRADGFGAVGFRVGRAHDRAFWTAFIGALRTAGYDDVLSIENEDRSQPPEEGVRDAAAFINPLLSG